MGGENERDRWCKVWVGCNVPTSSKCSSQSGWPAVRVITKMEINNLNYYNSIILLARSLKLRKHNQTEKLINHPLQLCKNRWNVDLKVGWADLNGLNLFSFLKSIQIGDY